MLRYHQQLRKRDDLMHNFSKRIISLAVATLTVMMMFTGCAGVTNEYPNRPVEMIIPFGAGGASDIFARQYADITKDYLGTPITAVNKSGAGTVEGMAYAANLPKDGYTILEITPSVLIKDVTGEFEFTQYFEPLIKVQNDVMVFGVAADSQFQTMEEVIAYAKENPGDLTIGGLSPGGLDDYIANGFAMEAGFDWTYVPYSGGSEIKSAVLGGELDIYQDKLSSFIPLIESGDIRALVVLSEERIDSPLLTEVPSSVEMGIDFTQGSWRGFAIPTGTPEYEKEIIIKALTDAYSDPRYAELEESTKTNFSYGFLTPEEFGLSWQEEMDGLYAAFKEMGIIDENDQLVADDIEGDILGEMGFPIFIASLAVILAIIIFAKSFKKAGSIEKMFAFNKPETGMVTTILCLAFYIGTMNIIGFTLSTLLFTFFNARLMGYKNNKVLAIFSLILTALIVLAFGKLFLVPLPRGISIFRELSYLIY